MLTLLEIHKQNAALLQKMDERQDRMDARQERVEADIAVLRTQSSITYMTALEALELARKTADRLPERRRGATLSTAAICREVNSRMFEGRCPRCRCRIIERTNDGSLRCLPNADLHHQHGRSRNHPTQMCYVCHECNQALEDPAQQAQFGPTFQAIVIVVKAMLDRSQQLGLFEGEVVA